MQTTLTEKEAEAFLTLKNIIRNAGTPPDKFMYWVAERLVEVHKESEIVDYVQKLREYGRDFNRLMQLLDIIRY